MRSMEAHPTPSACNLRIVCLCQGAIEAVCALGLQSYLVGRAQQCTGPTSVLSLPCVSSFSTATSTDPSPHCDIKDQNFNINWDLLEELKPDLIFTQSLIRADTYLPLQDQQLMDWKCRVVSLQSHTVEDIFENLQTIAKCCGVEKEGVKLVNILRSRWKNIKQKTPQWADGMPHVHVACLLCLDPLIGAGFWIPEIISCAGGVSLCGTAGCPSTSLTLGDLAFKNPDVIVYISYSLHAMSLATELAYLVANKEWRILKAIKANRFFLIDANRFFIDSAPNVVSSAEIMAEILHGFGYDHEGKGFVRWQNCELTKDVPDGKSPLQKTVVGTKAPRLVGDNGSCPNDIDVDKHEVSSSAAHDHPKYVTTVYTVKQPALARTRRKDLGGVNAKKDMGDRDLEILESKREDTQQAIMSAVKTQKHMPEKTIRQVSSGTVLNGEKVFSNYSDKNAIDSLVIWPKPGVESLSRKQSTSPAPQESPDSLNSLAQDQMDTMVDVKRVRGSRGSQASSNALPKQSVLKKIASSGAYSQATSFEDSFYEQELISKVWESTKSAAQMRSKERMFQKSISLPVSRVSSDRKASSAISTHLLGESPQTTSSLSIKNNINKPLPEGTSSLQKVRSPSYASSDNYDQANTTQISSGRKYEQKAVMVPESRASYSVLSSPGLDAKSRKSRMIRDAVLKSLVDLPDINCLLLSGGLASSILAEAVPLVHSKGFKLGFTVLAGPAATDRVSSAVAAKCKGMQHIIIGESEKGFAVFLLAKELAFIVETLKTFDPVQIRNLVPIAAALREARSRGLSHVVTGDGLDELLFRDGVSLNDAQTTHLGILKVLSKSAVLLGEALGIKVVQPFLHPKLIRECKAVSRTQAVENETTEYRRAIMREAFPEVSTACREKGFNEVDSGMFYVSDYFSSAISASVLEKKAKHIYEKERICIRDAEHLVYFRAFKKAFKGKPPEGMVRWASKPCSGCGYQSSSEMNWYCLTCGLTQHSHDHHSEQHIVEQAKSGHEENSLNWQGSHDRLEHSATGNVSRTCSGTCEEVRETNSVASHRSRYSDSRNGSKRSASRVKRQTSRANQSSQNVEPIAAHTRNFRMPERESIERKQPNLWAILGAGSAGLLLLLQLSRR